MLGPTRKGMKPAIPVMPVMPVSPVVAQRGEEGSTDPGPSAGHGDGVLGRLQRLLRPVPNGNGTFLFSQVRQAARGPGARPPPADAGLRQPDPDATEAGKLRRRRQRGFKAVGGAKPRRPLPEDRAGSRPAQATASLLGMFSSIPAGAAPALVARLMALVSPPPQACERPMLVGTVLSRLSGGHPLVAAAILDGLTSAEPTGPAFAAQRALARCLGPGLDCLLALQTEVVLSADPLLRAVQRDAFAARFLALEQLCACLPADRQPRSLKACVALARRATEPSSHPGRALAGEPIAVQGLVCAQTLCLDPGATVPVAQRCAYLALRNGIVEWGRFEKTRDRLFKLNTYVERASERGSQRFGHAVQRLAGFQKSPLHALTQLGTAQSKTRHPEDDFAQRCGVMDAFADGLEATLEAHLARQPRTARATPQALRAALRIRIVRQWKLDIAEHGWQDHRRLGHRARDAIAADAARHLGCPLAMARRHPALQEAGALNVELLMRWARQEAFDFDSPATPGAAQTFGDAMQRFQGMHRGGDILLHRPTAGQTRERLHEAIQDARQTYSVNLLQGNNVGVQAAINDLFLLTPLVVGAAPLVGLTGQRAAVLSVGSNAQGGVVSIGSQRGVHGEAGVSGFIGKKVGDVVNLGLNAALLPCVIDHTRTRAAVLRTPMVVEGAAGQPEAWRERLLQAVDTITWKDGEEGPPDDARQMWEQLANRFYKDPNLSIDDLHSQNTSFSGTATASAGARVGVGEGLQVGPLASVGAGKVYRNRFRQQEKGAGRTTEMTIDSASHGSVATLGLTGLGTPVTGGAIHDNAGHAGATQALTMPSASFGSSSVSVLRNAAGVTMRIAIDQGRVDADFSVMDTESGHAGDFTRYLDHCRSDWIEALGGGPAAAHELDVFLTRLRDEDLSGNVTFGERRRMTPVAARRIDYFRAMARAQAQASAGSAAQAKVARLEGEVTRVLSDPSSWDPRSIWVLDLNQEVRSKGLSLILQMVSRKSVSAARQRGVLVARHAAHRAASEEAEF